MRTKNLKKGKNSTISSLFAGIVVIMAMFLSVACEKDETTVVDQQQTVRKPQPISDMEVMRYLPVVVDGRLVFKDREVFDKYISWVSNNQSSPQKIIDINHRLGFISMKEIHNIGDEMLNFDKNLSETKIISLYEKYEQYTKDYPQVYFLLEQDGANIYELQTSNVLSFIANKYGIYQIGNSIYRTSYNKSYEILDGDVSKIPLIINDCGELTTKDGICVHSYSQAKDVTFSEYLYFDIDELPKRRMYVRFNATESAGDWYYDIRITGQRKFIAWITATYHYSEGRITRSSAYWKVGTTYYDGYDTEISGWVFSGARDNTHTIIIAPDEITYSQSYMYFTLIGEEDGYTNTKNYANIFSTFGWG